MFSEMHIYRESKITSVTDAHPDETVRRVVDAVTGMDESTVLSQSIENKNINQSVEEKNIMRSEEEKYQNINRTVLDSTENE